MRRRIWRKRSRRRRDVPSPHPWLGNRCRVEGPLRGRLAGCRGGTAPTLAVPRGSSPTPPPPGEARPLLRPQPRDCWRCQGARVRASLAAVLDGPAPSEVEEPASIATSPHEAATGGVPCHGGGGLRG